MSTHTQNVFPGPRAAPGVGWQGRLDESGHPDEVVAVARDFLARISPEELSGLPVDCRPRKIVDADDLVDYAVTLVRRSCASNTSSDVLLQHMATFFMDACSRLSLLGRPTPLASQ